MNTFDLITQEELDEAPDDPEQAFMQLTRSAQVRFAERTRDLDDSTEWGGRELEEARHGFMNVVVGLAKSYRIEPFVSMDVPRYENFDYRVHRQFRADLDHYMTQLMVNNSLKSKRDSVFIAPDLKEKIRKYVNGLKQAIDRSGLSDAKKASLLAKLAEFEAELEKRRLTLLAVTRLAVAVAMVPGGVWGSVEAGKAVNRLVSNVFQTVGEAKVVDDEEQRQLQPASAPLVLLPPRKDDGVHSTGQSDGGYGKRDDLDDEIPF